MSQEGESTEENLDDLPIIPEEASVILSTLHGRKRREDRGISKAAFAAAVKYGVKTPTMKNRKTGEKRWKFDYKEGGISVITNADCSKEVTSWAHPCWGLNVEKVPITKQIEEDHLQSTKESSRHDLWNSHTVAVVDQSGSMRTTDAENAVTRSDLVWICLAVDYIGKRLRTGEATNRDYFSLIELGPQAKCLIKEHPLNWILYNAIIDLLRTRQPLGPGYYLPAILCAKEMLSSNKSGQCLHQLVFLADGAPSDEVPHGLGFAHPASYYAQTISEHIASIARQFGSRLTIGAIAVGQGQYGALETMISSAKDYNCQTYLKKSSLNARDLSSAFISMSSLISASKSKSTDTLTNRQRTFRDLIREPQSSVSVYLPNEKEWHKYMNKPSHRWLNVRKTIFNKETREWDYPRNVFYDGRAVGVAVRGYIFGEGKERAVRRVREVDTYGHFVGPKLVGKESLFVEDSGDSISFHRTFLIVQELAQRYARHFNRQLLALPGVNKLSTPTINFLDCHVLLLSDPTNNIFDKGILVEKMLDVTKFEYKKWNNNDGYVMGMSLDEYNTMKNDEHTRKKNHQGKSMGGDCSFSIEDIPQAYSHFTYLASGRRFLVCDLQGVFNTDVRPPVFELTDPAIHYSEMTSRKDYGRTDRGEHGIQDFLKTHVCSNLCHMLLSRWIDDPLHNNIIQYEDVLDKGEQAPNLQEKTKGVLVRPGKKSIKHSKVKKSVRFG